MINDKKLKKYLPTQFNKKEQIPTVYILRETIRYKIFNHK